MHASRACHGHGHSHSHGGSFLALLTTVWLAVTLLAPTVAAEYTQKNITDTPGYKLLPGVSSVPAPVVVAPDQDWWGIDGQWNSFSLLVGTPAVRASVQVSSASQQIWVVNSQACIQNITDSAGKIVELNKYNNDCGTSRGYTFNQTISKTWRQKGFYQLWLEKNLGIFGNGLYGFDTVGLGLPGETGPTVANTTIGTLVTTNYWQGHLGLHPKPTNFSAFEPPVPSYMTSLFEQQNIPSMSFGYTAGSQYHGNTRLASLTLGGYDASKIIPNDLTFIFAPDNERELVVGVTGLTANTTDRSNINLLKRNDLNMFIDSTIAEIWLPPEICQAFETEFGLKYDNQTGLYLVDDVLHQTLVTRSPSITFTLGQAYRTDLNLQITLPYAALDLVASPPYRGLKQKTRYFPIRRASTDSAQWVLGRTFLQEAYIAVDWERQNFSVSAIDWTFGKAPQITAIVSPKYAILQAPPKPRAPLSTGVIIGIAVGVGLLFALVMLVVGWWYWRRRHQRKLADIKAKYEADAAAEAKRKETEKADEPPLSPVQDVEAGAGLVPKAELPGQSAVHYELSSDTKEKDALVINEADNTEQQIYEMPGDIPERPEAGGRQLSEKESMVIRERLYNGVDPQGTPDVSPTEPRRLAPISPAEVTMLNGRLPSPNNVSPVTPRTPRDGAFLEASDTFFQLPPYRPPRDALRPEDTLLSPISPMEGSTDTSRRRFSYES